MAFLLLFLLVLSESRADNFDEAYSDLEHYRTIYISGKRWEKVCLCVKVNCRKRMLRDREGVVLPIP